MYSIKYLARALLIRLLCFLPVSRLFSVRRLLLNLCGFRIGSQTRACGGGSFYGRGELVIGEATWLSPRVIFYTHPDAQIKIGSRCDIGHGVEFIPGSHLIGTSSRRAGKGTAKPIEIGDGCWIGAKSVILGGVRIGVGSFVAAGSVVTRNVPDNVMVAGVPARIKRDLGE